jgi:hypothetical protein
MNELLKIVLTACLTLLGGVMLLVFSQIFTRLLVDPFIEFRRLLGEIGHALVLYSDCFFNASATASTPKFEEGKRQCRVLASRLRSFSNAVPCYSFLARCHRVPRHEDVYEASACLIGLSNTTAKDPATVVQQRYNRISKLLGIRVDDSPDLKIGAGA